MANSFVGKPAKSHGTPKSSTEQAWAYGELIII